MLTKFRILLLFLFHFFGLIACYFDALKPLFAMSTAYHLIVITLLLFFNKKYTKTKFIITMLIVFLVGMSSEIIGVQTGYLFGHYHYTSALGIQVWGVPVLIGITWASTAYACNTVAIEIFKTNKIFSIILAGLLMVAFDMVLEKFATAVPLWQWDNGVIPIYNYVCWFFIGGAISAFLQYRKMIDQNPVGLYYLLTQVVFFGGYLLIAN